MALPNLIAPMTVGQIQARVDDAVSKTGGIAGPGTGQMMAGPLTGPNFTAQNSLQVGNITWTVGVGLPVATSPKGCLYTRTDGDLNTCLYISQGNALWYPVPTLPQNSNQSVIGQPNPFIVNVLDWLPTGQPDGMTDNTSQVQGLLNYAAGLVHVYFPHTTNSYITHGLVVPSNSHLEIDGTIKLMNGTNAPVIDLGGSSNIKITGLGGIDGNRVNQSSAGAGIVGSGCSDVIIDGLTIANTTNWPISITNGLNCHLKNIIATNAGNAIQFVGASTNCWADNLTLTSIADSGFLFHGAVSKSGISNSSISACQQGVGVINDTVSSGISRDIMISGNWLFGNAKNGVVVDRGVGGANNHVGIAIRDNRIFGNNTSNTSNYGGIYNVTGDYSVIEGNLIGKNGNGSSGSAGIYHGSNNALIAMNMIYDEGQGSSVGVGITFASTCSNTKVSNNFIFDDQNSHTMQHAFTGTIGANVSFDSNKVNGMISTINAVSLGSDSSYMDNSSGNLTQIAASIVMTATNGITLNANGLTSLGAVSTSTRVVTAAGPVTMLNSDRKLIINQTVGASIAVTLPPNPVVGQDVVIIDRKGDFASNNCTVSGFGGAAINGSSSDVLATNGMTKTYTWTGTEWVK